jgi:tetratricopeptide (TPR) repeat protein
MQVKTIAACVLAAIVLASVPSLQAQSSFEAARGLYAAANYTEALAMLDRLLSGGPSDGERQSIELYRALCLVAINRKDEANRAIDRMITHDPLYRPTSEDVPPRLRAAFSDARRRMLPSLIQQNYVEAKAAYDRADFTAAARGFKYVMDALADPDIADVAARPPLSDLRTLAGGFQELTAKAMAPPPAPAPAAAAAPPPAPAAASEQRAVVRLNTRIYGVEDGEVRQPVVINQSLPPYPGTVTGWATGVLEVIIDETGAVESAAMLVPISPQYDKVIIEGAMDWQYRPATLDGMPVKFRKRIQVRLSPRT